MLVHFKLGHIRQISNLTVGVAFMLVSCVGISFCGALPPCSTKYAAELEKKQELLSEIKEDTYMLEIGVKKDLDRQQKEDRIKEYNMKRMEVMGRPLTVNPVQPYFSAAGMSSMCSAVTPEKNPEFIKTRDDK